MNNEDIIALTLFGVGFAIPVLMFLVTYDGSTRLTKPTLLSKQRWRERFLLLALLSSIALFFFGDKDAAIVMALVLLIIQKMGWV